MSSPFFPEIQDFSKLGRGVYIANLWYLNWSDRTACRMTGMTRFATFWVQDGEVQAPLARVLPDCDLERVSVVGNAAGYGARMALVSRSKRVEATQLARQVKYLELTADPGLQPLFLSSTRFPEPTRDTKAGCAG